MTQNFGNYYSPENQEKIQQAKALEDKIARKIAWKKLNLGIGYNITEKDGKLYFSMTSYIPSIGLYGQTYMRRKTENGLTFDGKKVRFWFGKTECFLTMSQNDLAVVLKALKIDWLLSKKDTFIVQHAVSKPTILAKILSFKITNFTDLTKFLIKNYKLRCSAATFDNYVTDSSHLYFLKKISRLTENVDENAKVYFGGSNDYQNVETHTLIQDILNQAETLEEKVDLRWSSKRLNEVHTDFTRRLMLYEVETVPEDYFGIPKVQNIADLHGIEYITTSKRLYIEGYTLKHCVYTSYGDITRKKQYLVFNINGHTLGLRMHKNSLNSKCISAQWDQLYGKFNSSPDAYTTTIAESFVKNLNEALQEKEALLSV